MHRAPSIFVADFHRDLPQQSSIQSCHRVAAKPHLQVNLSEHVPKWHMCNIYGNNFPKASQNKCHLQTICTNTTYFQQPEVSSVISFGSVQSQSLQLNHVKAFQSSNTTPPTGFLPNQSSRTRLSVSQTGDTARRRISAVPGS